MPTSTVLIPHPSTPCAAIRRFGARAAITPEALLALDYVIEGGIDGLAVPGPAAPGRVDGLWRHTCLEAFLAVPGLPGYWEFNLAPSGEWAAYRFAAYREGMAAVEPGQPPSIRLRRAAQRLELSAAIDLRGLLADSGGGGFRVGLSAVVEDKQGGLSYWALAHPPGKPDFHHDRGFALSLGFD